MADVLELVNVRKQYQSLRPLRVNALQIAPGERVAVSGLDAGAAEVLVNLVTGASLPDEGEVRIFGQPTASIADGDEWLASLDRFGIVSPRAVLLDAATVLQNLVMPLTLAIDEIPQDAEQKARALARDAGLGAEWLDRPVAGLPPVVKARVHLVRAVALDPALLVLEHPTVGFSANEGQPFGASVASVALGRNLAVLIISEDADFSSAAATRRFALHAASGDLKRPRRNLFGW
jgi:predicted ABC-type transport system involved in lysophospholipase L1 biosynthesis ATPase subunit